jgi:2-polyprenyl-6-methoxyphenol hydroxylase-like FAD-dependent oxidoreductase
VSGLTAESEVPVLVVGGSLVGLSTALLLAQHGIEPLVVERHSGTAIHPRAGHFNLRTLEILRSAGLEDAVRRRSREQYPPDGGISNVESLAGREIATFFADLNAGVAEFSPTIRLFINQDALEPILRVRAAELGARMRYGTECTALEQDEDGVTAELTDVATGTRSRVRARYVVAADGNRSPARSRLGIALRGHGVLSNSITIYFRAERDLKPLLAGRNQGVHYVTNPVLRGFFRLDRGGNGGFLVVNLVGDTARPEIVAAYPEAPWANVAEGITKERALELLRAAIGVPGMPLVIEDIATWQAVADIAERYSGGRVFLAGDAVHVVPPNGGFGGNTGVQDAHNLAWKLAAVLHGTAGPGLLATYDAERRPVGEFTVEQSYARYVTRVAPYLGTAGVQQVVDDLYLELGYRYDSTAVIAEPVLPDDGPADDGLPDDGLAHRHPRDLRAQPGSRAPHVFLDRDGATVSTLDLFGRNFVLLAGPVGGAWRDAARSAADRLGVGLDAYLVAGGDRGDSKAGILAGDGARFRSAYRMAPDGAVLVRPDGFVAWRAEHGAGATAGAMAGVLSRVLHREDAIRLVTPLADEFADEDEGGDAVCWAHLVCDECGAITTEGHRDGCPRSR